jgi:YVTN family beta-propeller protein
MKTVFLALLLGIAPICFSQAPKLPGKTGSKLLLSNGWSLSPAGRSIPLGDLPLNIAVSASKKWIAVTNNGQGTQTLQLIDVKAEKQLDSVVIPKSWYGLRFGKNDKYLYASGGNDNWILKYEILNNRLKLRDSIILGKRWPNRISPAGFDIDESRQLLYVVTRENNRLYVVDLKTKQKTDSLPLGGEGYTCVLSPDNKQLYISCWGCDKLVVFDTWKKRITREFQIGDNPNEICLSKDGTWLYVANANDNSVSVINTKKEQLVETLNAALYPSAPSGSTTNGLALSDDNKTLFIANADNNCLAVFDVSTPGQSKSKGFIPVGWYPTNVKVIGRKILVSNGKGFTSLPNPHGPNPFKPHAVWYQHGDTTRKLEQYIGSLFKGTLSIIDMPTEQQMSTYSKLVYENTPYSKNKELTADFEAGGPIPQKIGDKSPIKHVFYIIKENRTYDQVLGDVKEGNGDPSLTLFGENITPNQHALTREFVLLDNFYVDAEVSADGHNWSMGAYATDYLEKNWPSNYSSRGGDYASEGTRAIANNKNGFIWDNCRRNNVTYRTYGEFADDYKPNIPVLRDHYCPYFTSWDQHVRDTTRVGQWKRDFDSMIAINKVPQLNTLRFINDHTEGMAKGRPTPFAHVADNDLAVGMFLEYLSKSPIWKESVVFILEDDAQNGADHVDAHRSPVYLAGGLVKRGFVDHTMYSTTSVIRTIELILGLPPMSQYDAAATPMWRCFTNNPNLTSFQAKPISVDLNLKNVAMNEWQRRSEKFNLTREDAVPDLEFNMVLWHGIKGDNVPFPAPRRAAFVKLNEKTDKDDD